MSMSVLGGLVKRVDAWANVLTGLGTTRDKVTWTLPTQQRRLPDELAASIFRGDDVARKILTKLPSEMLRNGFSIKVQTTSQRSGPDEELPEMDRADAHQTITDLETSSALTMRHQELGTAAACLKGLVWGRTFGAGVLVLGVEDGGRPEDPLREDAIRSFRYIHVFDRRSVTVDRFYDDPLAPGFGKPEVFRLQPVTASRRGSSTVLVHESRCVVFPGVLTEDLVRAENGGWDDSLLQSLWTTLQREATNWATIGHLLSDASQGVYKVKGLLDIIARGEKAAMQTRAELIEICRSAARAIVVDAEHEGFERVATPMAGIPEIADRGMMRAAAGADMPVTVLWGRSPAGLNATGESDTRGWYDSVEAARGDLLTPALERITTLMMLAKDGPTKGVEPEAWQVVYEPLWRPTTKERAEERKAVADTDKAYVDAGVLLPEEVAASRFRPEGWNAETTIDLDARRQILDLELKRAVEEAENPPEPPPAPPGAPENEPAQGMDPSRSPKPPGGDQG